MTVSCERRLREVPPSGSLTAAEAKIYCGLVNSSCCHAPRAGAKRHVKAPARCQPRTLKSRALASPDSLTPDFVVVGFSACRISMTFGALGVIRSSLPEHHKGRIFLF